MELTVELELSNDDILKACKEYAEGHMPVIPGYHVEIKATETYYSRTAKARLVKDEKEKEAE
jgi:hypothetical protein